LVTDFHSILARWSNHFSQLLKAYGINNVRLRENTVEPLMPEPSAFEVELAIEKLKSHVSPSIDRISAELIKERCRTIRSEIHIRIFSILNKEEFPEKRM
jgi:hypothetical protein